MNNDLSPLTDITRVIPPEVLEQVLQITKSIPPMVMVLGTLIPIIMIIGGVTLIYFLMKLRNDHRALLIEKGLYRRLTPREIQRRFYLAGIILLVLGLSFLAGLIPLVFLTKSLILGFVSVKLLFMGLIFTFFGIGFLIYARTAFSAEELQS